MAHDTLEALDAGGSTAHAAAEWIHLPALLARLATQHPHAVRLEKVRIELRAELGRVPSERETWVEFEARHPHAAQRILKSAVAVKAGELGL
jgi:hypothetical protein